MTCSRSRRRYRQRCEGVSCESGAAWPDSHEGPSSDRPAGTATSGVLRSSRKVLPVKFQNSLAFAGIPARIPNSHTGALL